MPFPILLALAAGMTLLQQKQQGDQNESDKELAGAVTRYSPWTGLKAGPIRKVDTAGNIAKGIQTYGAGGGTIPGIGGGAAEAASGGARSAMGVDYSPLEKFSQMSSAPPQPGLMSQMPEMGSKMGLGLDASALSKVGSSMGMPAGLQQLQELAKKNGVSLWDLLSQAKG